MPNEVDTRHEDHESRLSKIEALLESVVLGFRDFQSETKADISAIRSAVSGIGKTSWPLIVTIIIGGLTAFLGSVTLIITIGVLALSPIASNQVALSAAQESHESSSGHSDTLQKQASMTQRMDRAFDAIEAVENAVMKLDTDLQREMRDLDAKSVNEFNRWATMLENRIETGEEWRVDHDQHVAPLNAAQWAEIRDNKAEIDRLRESPPRRVHP